MKHKPRFHAVGQLILFAGLALATASAWAGDESLTPISFGTNWFAQAEHGGFYQARAEGLYRDAGLDVTIEMGGPQVNGIQLLVAGKTDFYLGYGMEALYTLQQGLPLVTVAAAFQRSPQGFAAHDDVDNLADLKDKALYVGSAAETSYWPWLKSAYGFTDDQKNPYAYNVAPFLHDENSAVEVFVTSEPYAIEQGGQTPKLLLFADYGYPPYVQAIVTTRRMIDEHPDIVRRFVAASIDGWRDYMADPGAGNQLIKKANPEMSDAQLAYSMARMKQFELVTGGDAQTYGIGVMTDTRWQQTFDFMVKYGLVPNDLDYRKAYTLNFLPYEITD